MNAYWPVLGYWEEENRRPRRTGDSLEPRGGWLTTVRNERLCTNLFFDQRLYRLDYLFR